MAVSQKLTQYYENKMFSQIEAFHEMEEENATLFDASATYTWRKGTLWKRTDGVKKHEGLRGKFMDFLREKKTQMSELTKATHQRMMSNSFHVSQEKESHVSHDNPLNHTNQHEEDLDGLIANDGMRGKSQDGSSFLEMTSLSTSKKKEKTFGVNSSL